ncbi:MAG: hypothetical protein ACOC5T_00510 [Elusimicrobiota bacterium]
MSEDKNEDKKEEKEIKVFSESVLKRRKEAEEFVKSLGPKDMNKIKSNNIKEDKKRLKKWKKQGVPEACINRLENIIEYKENRR